VFRFEVFVKKSHHLRFLSIMDYPSYVYYSIVECPLILGAGHPKFKNLQYLLCDLLDLTKPFIPVISEL